MIVGLAGYATSGKSSLAKLLEDRRRLSFAAVLKDEVSLMLNTLGIQMDFDNPEHKKKYRDFLVFWGAFRRKQDPDHWIKQLYLQNSKLFQENAEIVIDDVRYSNEARWIQEKGGMVIYISRPGIVSANSEEAQSLADLRLMDSIQFLNNDGCLWQSAKTIRRLIKSFLTNKNKND